MPFLNIPLKSIQADVISVIGIQTMGWYDPQDFPVLPSSPLPPVLPKDFRWRLNMNVTSQQHSSYNTRSPGIYNGQDISVGQWIANSTTGQAWQIISIESKSINSVTAIVQDVYRYNIFRDPSQVGNGAPAPGSYIVFNIGEDGFPIIDPIPPSGVSTIFSQNLQSRFEYINLQYDYPLYQNGNTFNIGDAIAVDPGTNNFVLSSSSFRTVVGRVTSISDTMPGWFTINPVQKVVDNLDYLPGDVGDIIYTSLTTPGQLTLTPGGTQLYVKLKNNTQSVSYSTLNGPTAIGSVFQLNGIDITVLSPGDKNAVVNATNAVSLQTGVVSSLVLDPTIVETNFSLVNSFYGGEVALYADPPALPASALINNVLVTFNIKSTDTGYTEYALPQQMALAINNASIPSIIATVPEPNKLRITNISGGEILISNITNDVNNIPFAGTNSATGLLLSTPATTTNRIQFLATDARPINFLDISGSATADFGFISVENGQKAAGLYIEEGLRTATCTVVTDLPSLYSLDPLVGDQAYVINSVDIQGNNYNQWSLWIFDGSIWIKTATQDSATTDAKSIEYLLTTNSPSTINIGQISTGRRVALITVEVISAFNQAATIDIGFLVNNPATPPLNVDDLMPNTIIDLTHIGTYTTQTDILFGTDTLQGDVNIIGTFNSNAATIGTAKIIVSYV